MNKLNFSELMNLLLITVIIILILRFDIRSNTTPNQKEITSHKKNVATTETLEYNFTKLNDSIYQLPAPQLKSDVSIEECMNTRRSQRNYTTEAISINQLSQILWAAYGITHPIEEPAFLRGGLKTAPSAGALYPLDIYVFVGNVEKLPKGVYKFIPKNHQLKKVIAQDLQHELCLAALEQLMVQEAPATLVYTAVFKRCTSKYGDRGRERYVCMDLGHSAENVYLQVQSMGLGTCAIGAFDDARVSELMQLNAEEEPLYIMPVGYYTN